jgi:hypothetical protein
MSNLVQGKHKIIYNKVQAKKVSPLFQTSFTIFRNHKVLLTTKFLRLSIMTKIYQPLVLCFGGFATTCNSPANQAIKLNTIAFSTDKDWQSVR